MKNLDLKLIFALLAVAGFTAAGFTSKGCRECRVTVYDTITLVDTIHVIHVKDSINWVFDTVIIRDTVKEVRVQVWDNYYINISSLSDSVKPDIRKIIDDVLKRCDPWP